MSNENDQEVIARSLKEFRRLTFREFIYSIMHAFEDFDYSLPQVASLLLLDEDGEKTIKQVAEWLGHSVSTTSRLLDHLVVRGMITRREDERDRRMKRVALTAQGRALIATVEQQRANVQIESTEYLSPEEQAEVHRAMILLVEGARRMREQYESATRAPGTQRAEPGSSS
ncbi:MAG: MarR family winged helix-turn-helix transcriptional regulator [Chloroflexota bacterium]|nr:MarR family winged helix-turn-helix transcriptional regulator [Chloroflexota bacterium]